MVRHEFKPSSIVGIWVKKYVNEIIEKYLSDNWTEDNDTPKKSEISFGYALGQEVGTATARKKVAIKCLDGGLKIIDKGTNYASAIYINTVVAHLEASLTTGNFQKDSPISLEQTKQTILDIINGDPTALQVSEGFNRMIAETSDPVYPLKDRPNFFGLDVNITVTRFMTRI